MAKRKDRTTHEAPSFRKPKRFRRLLVSAPDTNPDGSYPGVRDVYLQSSHVPPGFMTDANTRNEMFGLSVDCMLVIDLVKWAESMELPVTFEPDGNMAGYWKRKPADADVQYLFDIG